MSFTFKLEQDKNIQRSQKVYFFLLGLLFLVAPFYFQSNLGGEGLYIPHNSVLWIVALSIITCASWLMYKRTTITLPQFWLGLAFLPIGAIITGYIADNNNPIEWFIRISVIIGGYLFFIALFQFRLSSRMTELGLYLVVVMGVISASYGILQIQSDTSFGLGFLAISPHNLPYGNFQQINLQASLMATVLVICFYLISRPVSQSHSFILTSLLIVGVLVSSYILAMSGSRIGALGAILGLIVMLLARWKLYQKRNKFKLIALFTALIAGIVIGQSGITKTGAKFERALGGMEQDIRWKVYRLSWDLFTEAPVVGHGVGSFQKVFQDKRAESYTDQGIDFGASPRFSHPHNELILWAVEGGILAIVGILIAAITTLAQLFKLGYQRGLGYAALLIPITLHTQVELPFYISNVHWLLLLFLLFLVHRPFAKQRITDNMSNAAQKTLPVVFLTVTLFTSYQLVTAQVANAGIIKYFKQKQPVALTPALEHFYFKNYATYLLLRLNMILGSKSGDTEALKRFIEWAETDLKTTPAAGTYRDLIFAYNSIGFIDKRDRLLTQALAIYPHHPSLQNMKESFASP